MTNFVGNICADAVTKTVQVGGVPTLVTNFSVAENYQGSDGQRKTQFYRISLWREAGAKLAKYLVKGRPIEISGRVRASAYIDQEGHAKAQLEMANPRITFITANPTQDVEATAAPEGTVTEDEPF